MALGSSRVGVNWDSTTSKTVCVLCCLLQSLAEDFGCQRNVAACCWEPLWWLQQKQGSGSFHGAVVAPWGLCLCVTGAGTSWFVVAACFMPGSLRSIAFGVHCWPGGIRLMPVQLAQLLGTSVQPRPSEACGRSCCGH